MKDNKGQPQWQKNGQQGQSSQDKKSGSCECPVGSGNNQHKDGAKRDERAKQNNNSNNNQPKNENNNNGENKSRKWENE